MAKRTPVVWTRPALDSLLRVVRYIQLDNPNAARDFVSSIRAKVTRLEKFPESGRLVPEFPSSGLRELIIGDYRVIYRVTKRPGAAQILAVHHGAQPLKAPPET